MACTGVDGSRICCDLACAAAAAAPSEAFSMDRRSISAEVVWVLLAIQQLGRAESDALLPVGFGGVVAAVI